VEKRSRKGGLESVSSSGISFKLLARNSQVTARAESACGLLIQQLQKYSPSMNLFTLFLNLLELLASKISWGNKFRNLIKFFVKTIYLTQYI